MRDSSNYICASRNSYANTNLPRSTIQFMYTAPAFPGTRGVAKTSQRKSLTPLENVLFLFLWLFLRPSGGIIQSWWCRGSLSPFPTVLLPTPSSGIFPSTRVLPTEPGARNLRPLEFVATPPFATIPPASPKINARDARYTLRFL